MKARLIKNNAGKEQFLYSDGSLSHCTNDRLYEFLRNFKNCDQFYGEDGNWKTETMPDMSLYPGQTLAMISDDYHLLILDFTPFCQILDEKFYIQNYISAEEFGKRHNRSAEMVKVYCREGRIPGAKQIGTTWVIPADAAYPVAPRHRRDDLSSAKRGKPKSKTE